MIACRHSTWNLLHFTCSHL